MLERLAGIILPVFLIVGVGFFYARRAQPDMATVNRISMQVLAPALVFSALSSKEFDAVGNAMLMLATVGVVIGSGVLAWPFARLMHVEVRTFVPPMMFNNCGNLGLPLAALAFGPAGLSAMVALFAISNLLHFTLGQRMMDPHAPLGNVLRTPVVIATVLGFAFALTHPPMPEWLMTGIRLTGDAMVPLMLLSLGARLSQVEGAHWGLGIVGGLVCPLTGLAVAALLGPLLRLTDLQQSLLVLFGCLPPAVLNFMVAEQFGQEPAKVASIVLISHLVAMLFVPLGIVLALHQ